MAPIDVEDDWEAPAYPDALRFVLWVVSCVACTDGATKLLLRAVAAATAPTPTMAMLEDWDGIALQTYLISPQIC